MNDNIDYSEWPRYRDVFFDPTLAIFNAMSLIDQQLFADITSKIGITPEYLDYSFYTKYGCRLITPIASDARNTRSIGNIVLGINSANWKKLLALYDLQYNPIQNYDRTETETVTIKGNNTSEEKNVTGETSTENITDTESHTNKYEGSVKRDVSENGKSTLTVDDVLTEDGNTSDKTTIIDVDTEHTDTTVTNNLTLDKNVTNTVDGETSNTETRDLTTATSDTTTNTNTSTETRNLTTKDDTSTTVDGSNTSSTTTSTEDRIYGYDSDTAAPSDSGSENNSTDESNHSVTTVGNTKTETGTIENSVTENGSLSGSKTETGTIKNSGTSSNTTIGSETTTDKGTVVTRVESGWDKNIETTVSGTIHNVKNDKGTTVDENQSTIGDVSTTTQNDDLSGNTTRVGNYSTNGTGDKSITGEETREQTRELRNFGNIGVTTSQQMINSEIELWKWNFVETILSDTSKVVTIPIW